MRRHANIFWKAVIIYFQSVDAWSWKFEDTWKLLCFCACLPSDFIILSTSFPPSIVFHSTQLHCSASLSHAYLPACVLASLLCVPHTHTRTPTHTHTHAHILVQRLSFENTWRGNTPYTMSIHSLEIQFLRTNYATSAPIQGCFRDFLSNHTNLHRPHQLNWFVSWAHLRSTLLARKVSLQR